MSKGKTAASQTTEVIRRRAAVAAKAINECNTVADLYLLGCDIARLQLNDIERKGLRREYKRRRAVILNLAVVD